jgi:hypothetical protein
VWPETVELEAIPERWQVSTLLGGDSGHSWFVAFVAGGAAVYEFAKAGPRRNEVHFRLVTQSGDGNG